jgi:hypothetical protein
MAIINEPVPAIVTAMHQQEMKEKATRVYADSKILSKTARDIAGYKRAGNHQLAAQSAVALIHLLNCAEILEDKTPPADVLTIMEWNAMIERLNNR